MAGDPAAGDLAAGDLAGDFAGGEAVVVYAASGGGLDVVEEVDCAATGAVCDARSECSFGEGDGMGVTPVA